MKKSYKWLIITSIILIMVIIILLLVIINLAKKNKENDPSNDDINMEAGLSTVYSTQTRVTSDTSFFTISNYVSKYYRYLGLDIEGKNTVTADMLSIVNISTQEEKKNILLDMLDNEYKEENNINIDNIYDFTGEYNANMTYTPIEMFIKSDGNIEQYSVYGRLVKEEDSGIKTAYTYIIVNVDLVNATYSIELLNSKQYSSIEEIELNVKEENIEKNDNNKYVLTSRTDYEKSAQFLNMYKQDAMYDPERAYYTLDEEYRTAKFGSLDEYKEYVNSNLSYIKSCYLSEYTVTEGSDYTQYVCLDTKGNYYVFRETDIMQYTLLLDTYTIDIEEFTTKYNKSSNKEKVALNINKFIQAVNSKDYKYLYGILADSFKNNKFKTQDSLEDYIENNFYSYNTIELLEYSESGDNCIYTAYLKNKTGSSSKNISFIMQLNSGTDFIMSFSIE